MKFHITEDGPKVCTASKRACPIGGEHFEDQLAAQLAYERVQGSAVEGVKKLRLPTVTVTTTVTPQAGGRYFGCHVERTSLDSHLKAFRSQVGAERAAIMEANKAARDRGYVYHLTVVTPPEMKSLAGGLSAFPPAVNVSYDGIGSAEDKGSEAWFVVCSSPELESWRRENTLAPKDFHITLGFEPKDVHTKPKGKSSIVIV